MVSTSSSVLTGDQRGSQSGGAAAPTPAPGTHACRLPPGWSISLNAALVAVPRHDRPHRGLAALARHEPDLRPRPCERDASTWTSYDVNTPSAFGFADSFSADTADTHTTSYDTDTFSAPSFADTLNPFGTGIFSATIADNRNSYGTDTFSADTADTHTFSRDIHRLYRRYCERHHLLRRCRRYGASGRHFPRGQQITASTGSRPQPQGWSSAQDYPLRRCRRYGASGRHFPRQQITASTGSRPQPQGWSSATKEAAVSARDDATTNPLKRVAVR